jgi:hypothetical protein
MLGGDTMFLPRFGLLRAPDRKICSVRGYVLQ